MRGLKILSFGTTTLMVPTPLKVDTPRSLTIQTPPQLILLWVLGLGYGS